MTDLSLVVPVYNEEQNIPLLFDAIHEALKSMEHSWEVIFVDDGSRDGSLSALESLVQKNEAHVRVVVFRRNFGQTAAIAAGIDHSEGEIIVLLDADMQNDPADIPMLLEKLDEGYDLVSGWRKDRKDNRFTRTIPSNMANGLISWVTGVHLHDYGCTLKAYRRGALEGFRLYGEMHRFIPVFAHSVGAKITELPVRHHPRKFGEAKYGLERTVKVVLDLFTVKFLLDYSHKPMRLFGGTGVILIGNQFPLAGVSVHPQGILFYCRAHFTIFSDRCYVLNSGIPIHLNGLDRRTIGTHLSRIAKQAHVYCSHSVGKETLECLRWWSKNRQLIFQLAGTLLAVGLLYVLLKDDGWNEIVNAFKKIKTTDLLWVTLLFLISRTSMALRWHVLLRSGGVDMHVKDSISLTYTGLFASNFLPSTIGGDVVKLAGAMQMGYDRAVCLASIAADRLIGMTGMTMVLPIGVAHSWSLLGTTTPASFSTAAWFKRPIAFLKRTFFVFKHLAQETLIPAWVTGIYMDTYVVPVRFHLYFRE